MRGQNPHGSGWMGGYMQRRQFETKTRPHPVKRDWSVHSADVYSSVAVRSADATATCRAYEYQIAEGVQLCMCVLV